MKDEQVVAGFVLDEQARLTLGELCQVCAVHAEVIIEMVEEGIVEPADRRATPWQFSGVSLRRVRITLRLRQDLAINLAGAALVLQLLDDIDALESRLRSARG